MKISKLFKNNYLLLLILVVAFILRLYKLGSIPPHLTPDEASLGYNAYSILKTGRDEYGSFLPIIFKSFGDFKPGFYIYLTVPFVALFGLAEFAVRLPSALAGVVAVFLIYRITEILRLTSIAQNDSRNKELENGKWKMENLAAFLLAVSPWHVHFSRGAWEVNVALTLTLAGIYFFLKSFKDQKFFVLSVFFFALTYITYQGAKLATTIPIILLVLLYWKKLFKIHKKVLLGSLLLGVVICFPIILSILFGKTGRLTVFSVFSYPRPEEYLQTFLDQGNEKVGSLSYYLYHPEWLNFSRGIMGRWFNHFSGRFLFFEGDWSNLRHSAPNHGMLLLIDLLFLPMGLVFILKNRISKEKLFVLLWLVLAPLPSILSRDQVHAVRAYNVIVPLVIISAFGVNKLIEWISGLEVSGLRVLSYALVFIFYLLSFIFFLDAYFIHLSKHNSKYWEYGYKQIVESVTPIQSQFKTIKIQQSFAQPYIYFLFFQKYNPAKYQTSSELIESEYKGDVGYVTRLDNIEFVPIDWQVNRGDHGSLIIGDPIRIPDEDSGDKDQFDLIKEIRYLDGNVGFKIIEVK